MEMLKEFKEFAVKGNLVDIAIGFVMGAAFKQVVTSFTGGIISPLVGLIFKADFKDLKWIAREKDVSNNISEVAVLYGDFLTNIIDFIIVAFVMFVIIKAINAMKKKEAPPATAEPSGPSETELLIEIRDLLSKK
jgi:large conductance mechanosensitive channel